MAISSQLTGTGDSVYYEEGFRALLEDHLSYIKANYCTQLAVSSENAYRNDGDFYGLMQDMGIGYNFHWLCMRLMGYQSPTDMNKDEITYILVPDESFVANLANKYKTKLSG